MGLPRRLALLQGLLHVGPGAFQLLVAGLPRLVALAGDGLELRGQRVVGLPRRLALLERLLDIAPGALQFLVAGLPRLVALGRDRLELLGQRIVGIPRRLALLERLLDIAPGAFQLVVAGLPRLVALGGDAVELLGQGVVGVPGGLALLERLLHVHPGTLELGVVGVPRLVALGGDHLELIRELGVSVPGLVPLPGHGLELVGDLVVGLPRVLALGQGLLDVGPGAALLVVVGLPRLVALVGQPLVLVPGLFQGAGGLAEVLPGLVPLLLGLLDVLLGEQQLADQRLHAPAQQGHLVGQPIAVRRDPADEARPRGAEAGAGAERGEGLYGHVVRVLLLGGLLGGPPHLLDQGGLVDHPVDGVADGCVVVHVHRNHRAGGPQLGGRGLVVRENQRQAALQVVEVAEREAQLALEVAPRQVDGRGGAGVQLEHLLEGQEPLDADAITPGQGGPGIASAAGLAALDQVSPAEDSQRAHAALLQMIHHHGQRAARIVPRPEHAAGDEDRFLGPPDAGAGRRAGQGYHRTGQVPAVHAGHGELADVVIALAVVAEQVVVGEAEGLEQAAGLLLAVSALVLPLEQPRSEQVQDHRRPVLGESGHLVGGLDDDHVGVHLLDDACDALLIVEHERRHRRAVPHAVVLDAVVQRRALHVPGAGGVGHVESAVLEPLCVVPRADPHAAHGLPRAWGHAVHDDEDGAASGLHDRAKGSTREPIRHSIAASSS